MCMPFAQSELASLCSEFFLEKTVLLPCPGNSVLPGSVFKWSSDRKQCQVPHCLHWKLPRALTSARYWIPCSGNRAMAQVSFSHVLAVGEQEDVITTPWIPQAGNTRAIGTWFSVLTGGWQLPLLIYLLLWVNLSSPMSRYGSKALFFCLVEGIL